MGSLLFADTRSYLARHDHFHQIVHSFPPWVPVSGVNDGRAVCRGSGKMRRPARGSGIGMIAEG